ncbi:tyrosine-type recombinase/integrase [Terasakiella pusilla]|uniref:tyrosine-type recombinase/integrase n=1 Tax=Terasakiella pusilla TaxID=64973 RepID=UPI003AA8E9B9
MRGRMRTKSTKTGNRQEAEQLLAVARERADAELLGFETNKKNPKNQRLDSVLSYFYVNKACEKRSSLQAKIAINHLNRIMPGTFVSEINRNWRRQYISARKREGVRVGTINREIAVLNSALSFGAAENLIPSGIKVSKEQGESARTRFLTVEEFAALLRECNLSHLKIFVLLGITTGARAQALFDLKWSDVDLENGIIFLNGHRQIKTSKERPTVRFSTDSALNIELQSLKDDRAALRQAGARVAEFILEYKGYAINSVSKSFASAVVRAGMCPNQVTPNTLRHTFATWLVQSGRPMLEVAAALGHRDTRMVENHYAHLRPDYGLNVAQSMNKMINKATGSPQIHRVQVSEQNVR